MVRLVKPICFDVTKAKGSRHSSRLTVRLAEAQPIENRSALPASRPRLARACRALGHGEKHFTTATPLRPFRLASPTGPLNPKGIPTSSPRLRAASYLGKTNQTGDNRNAVASFRVAWETGRNLVEVFSRSHRFPR